VFSYSERPGTAASDGHEPFGEGVPRDERRRRSALLRRLSDQKRAAFYRRQSGSARTVLWEWPRPDGRSYGLTDNYVQVVAADGERPRGSLETVRLGRLSAEGWVEGRALEG